MLCESKNTRPCENRRRNLIPLATAWCICSPYAPIWSCICWTFFSLKTHPRRMEERACAGGPESTPLLWPWARAVCCARARQPRPHSTHSDDEWHCYPLARGCLPILCAPFGTEAYCTAEVMVLLICRNQLIIAATLVLCICLAPYPLIWSGPIHPSWTNFSIPSLPALYASKRVTQNTDD